MENDSALAAVRSAAQSAIETTTSAALAAGAAQQPAAAQPGVASQPATATSAPADQVAQAKADGRKEGATAEKQRLSAIMKLDAAAERQSQALALALDTDVSAEQADAVLKATPAGAKAGGFDALMGKLGNPSLGAGGGKSAEVKPQIDRAGIFQRFNGAGKAGK